MKILKHPCGYCVSERGDIWSKTGRLLKQVPWGEDGYLMVSFGSVHRIVWETFNGKIPECFVINHKDGNKQNNNLSNLEVVTHSENTDHAYRLGLAKGKPGEENSQAKLSQAQFEDLCRKIMCGWSNGDLGEVFKIHPRYVSLIRHKKRWVKRFPVWYEKTESPPVLPLPYDFMESVFIATEDKLKTNAEIAEYFSLYRSTVSRIRSRSTWKVFIDMYTGIATTIETLQ